jgi:SAM-dependent methyltransferase
VEDAVACEKCDQRYPIVDEVPVLLHPEKSSISAADVVPRANAVEASRRVEQIAGLLPALSRSYGSNRNYERLAEELGGNRRVLVVGGRILGIGMEPLLERQAELLETDIALGPRTMLVCDAQWLPFADGTFDAVVIQGVLAQVPDAEQAVAEIHRVLADGGLVYAEDAFLQPVRGGAFDFHRWTHQGHRRLFRAFDEVDSGLAGGPATALAFAWTFFLLSFVRSRKARHVLHAAGRLSASWLKYLDGYLLRRPAAVDSASALFFLGRRSDRVLSDREIASRYRGAVGG